MTAVLPSLALALLCLLRAGAEIPVQPGFDAEKFAGVWHIVAAFSNCSDFLKMKDMMKSSITTISFTPEGNLAMEVVWPLPDRCAKIERLYQLNGQAGHYIEAQEKRDLRVVETDYNCYTIVHETRQYGQVHTTGMQLLTRAQDVSPQLLQKFEALIPTVGLTKDMLGILPKTDQCAKAVS